MTAELTVVCGATGGLGPSVLRAVRSLGGTVVGVTSPHWDRAALAGIDEDVTWELCDLADPGEVARLFERLDGLGPVRRLANLAGGFAGGPALEAPVEDLRRMLGVNLETAWWTCREAGRRMTSGGAIVNVASMTGVTLAPGAAAYAVSKAAVVALTRVLAAELRDAGVRVNAVAPSVIDTPANREVMPERAMARAVSPEAVARVIRHLLSEEAGATTGAVLPVDMPS